MHFFPLVPATIPTCLYWFTNNVDPSLLPSHFITHLGAPHKVCHTSRTPQFLVVHACIHTYVLVHEGFCPGVLSGFFCLEGCVRDGVCPYPFCQNASITTES